MKKNYRKSLDRVENLKLDDYIQIAGVLYCVDQIEIIGKHYTISFYNMHRPKLKGLLTLEPNTLMTIWNRK